MPKFRKKPIVIEAKRVGAPAYKALAEWCGGMIIYGLNRKPDGIGIETLEGTMEASRGDWIIRGIKGEFYPCKPDIFAETYEAVPDA